jgi:hypothetical protein
MVVFRSQEERDSTLRLFPFSLDRHSIKLDKPEEDCNRFAWNFACFAHITAAGFPLEHWDEGGIRAAF